MKYLFIAIPNNSGSNYVKRQIGRCKKAILIESGQKLFGQAGLGPKPVSQVWSLTPNIYNNPDNYQWDKIKELWNEHWQRNPKYDEKDPQQILVESSQGHPIRTEMLTQHFEDCGFILSLRNPYATCLSENNIKNKMLIARHWINTAEMQKKNRETLKNSIFFSYEEIGENPQSAKNKIKSFFPQLTDIDFENFKNGNKKHFEVLQESKTGCFKKLKRSYRYLCQINRVLRERKDLMEYYGYEYIDS